MAVHHVVALRLERAEGHGRHLQVRGSAVADDLDLMAEAEKRPREKDNGSLGSADGGEVEGGVVGDSHGRLVPELTTESGA